MTSGDISKDVPHTLKQNSRSQNMLRKLHGNSYDMDSYSKRSIMDPKKFLKKLRLVILGKNELFGIEEVLENLTTR